MTGCTSRRERWSHLSRRNPEPDPLRVCRSPSSRPGPRCRRLQTPSLLRVRAQARVHEAWYRGQSLWPRMSLSGSEWRGVQGRRRRLRAPSTSARASAAIGAQRGRGSHLRRSGGGLNGSQALRKRDEIPGIGDEHVVGHPTVQAEAASCADRRCVRRLAVVLHSYATAQTGAAAPRTVDSDWLTLFDRRHARPDRMDPPGILVTQSERQRKRNRVAFAVHHVEVRVAGPCRTDLDHDLSGSRRRLIYLDKLGFLVPRADLKCAHLPFFRSSRSDASAVPAQQSRCFPMHLATINHHRFSVDPGGIVADQKERCMRHIVRLTKTAHGNRVKIRCSRFRLRGGGHRCFHETRCDRIDTDAPGTQLEGRDHASASRPQPSRSSTQPFPHQVDARKWMRG